MMRQVYRQYAWMFVAFMVASAAVATLLSVIDFPHGRYFNAALLTVTFFGWMVEYIDARPLMYRRQRRLRLAFAMFLANSAYGSLNAAIAGDSDPRLRVALTSITGGAVLVSILFHPDNDYEIPPEIEFPWERWITRRLHH